MQRSALCRSRRELSNEYFLAKCGLDIAEKERCENSNSLTFLVVEFQLIDLTLVRIKGRKVLGPRPRTTASTKSGPLSSTLDTGKGDLGRYYALVWYEA